jgi:hypothetical protein
LYRVYSVLVKGDIPTLGKTIKEFPLEGHMNIRDKYTFLGFYILETNYVTTKTR